jgi:hypothetical protein
MIKNTPKIVPMRPLVAGGPDMQRHLALPVAGNAEYGRSRGS